MKIQAFGVYTGTLVIGVATPRPEAVPSTHFVAASIHEDYCATVRSALRRHKHVGESSLSYAATLRLQNYFPVFAASPIYAIRELRPAGSPRDIDPEFMLEIMRIRYDFVLNILPAAMLSNEVDAEAMERHMENATRKLFQALAIPDVFIPGDGGDRPGDRTEIDIVCEMGPGSDLRTFEIPAPAAT
jgi:hypothetical protein